MNREIVASNAAERALGWLSGAAAACVLAALVSGFAVRLSGAALACGTWPACAFADSPGAWVDLAHRGSVAAAGVLLSAAVVVAWVSRAAAVVRRFLTLAAAFAAADVLIGAALVWSAQPPAHGAVHALFGLTAAAFAAVVPLAQRGVGVQETLAAYVALTKPRVISLLLFTTLAGMFITPRGAPPWYLVLWTMIGGYLMAGAANAVNMWYDADIDDKMGRTRLRPIPSGRVTPRRALIFGLAMFAASLSVFVLFVNPAAAALAVAGFVYYTVIYTHWLKRSTWQNIVIGGGAGAIPPLIGWAAASGSLSWAALMLFLIVFYWTPPHFWALALMKRRDYAAAGVPMLPVVAGDVETSRQIVIYSFGMLALTLALVPLGIMSWIYLVGASVLGALFVYYAWRAWRAVTGHGSVNDSAKRGASQPDPEQIRRDAASKPVWALYGYSLLYLALLFVVMMIDRLTLA